MSSSATQLPQLSLTSCTRIVANGYHNAFCSLVQWRGHTYIAYREALSHETHPGGTIVVQRSSDLDRWEPVARFATGGDDRDPRLVGMEDGLCCLWGSSLPAYDLVTRRLSILGYDLWTCGVLSPDGLVWGMPLRLCRGGSWLWSCLHAPEQSSWFGASYDVGNRMTDIAHTVTLWIGKTPYTLYRWAVILDAYTRGSSWQPSEPCLFWRDPQRLGCFVRTEHAATTLYGEATEPFTAWTWMPIQMDDRASLHAPAVLAIPGAGLVVAGREYRAGRNRRAKPLVCRTTLWAPTWADDDLCTVIPLLSLPSRGDCSYPGLAWDSTRQELLCVYYSQHEREEVSPYLPEAADIYLARIAVHRPEETTHA